MQSNPQPIFNLLADLKNISQEKTIHQGTSSLQFKIKPTQDLNMYNYRDANGRPIPGPSNQQQTDGLQRRDDFNLNRRRDPYSAPPLLTLTEPDRHDRDGRQPQIE